MSFRCRRSFPQAGTGVWITATVLPRSLASLCMRALPDPEYAVQLHNCSAWAWSPGFRRAPEARRRAESRRAATTCPTHGSARGEDRGIEFALADLRVIGHCGDGLLQPDALGYQPVDGSHMILGTAGFAFRGAAHHHGNFAAHFAGLGPFKQFAQGAAD